MSSYKSEFEKYESRALLQKRALGEELVQEAHEAIEEIFAERGETLPPKPQRPVVIESQNKNDVTLKVFGGILLLIVATAVAKMVTQSWLLLPAAILFAIYYIFNWLRKITLSPEKREAEDVERKAKDEALTELMIVAADGNKKRVKELVAFGADVNAKSLLGTTALMYAARNNHSEIVDTLISAGAEINEISKKGSSAISLAEKFGHLELCEKLKQAGAKGRAPI